MGHWQPVEGSGALSAAVFAWDLLKEVTIIFITSTIVSLLQVKQQGSNTALPISRKLDLRFTEYGPAHQNKTQFPPTVSLSHQEASTSLLSLSIRAKTEGKPQSQKTNQSDHMDHSLV